MLFFLDLKKAFDLVNHNILLKKLSVYTANSPFVSLFKSYLELRPQSVYVNGDTLMKALFVVEFLSDLF